MRARAERLACFALGMACGALVVVVLVAIGKLQPIGHDAERYRAAMERRVR